MFKRGFTSITLGSLVIAAVVFTSSCTPMITEQQMQELRDLRQTERDYQLKIKEKDDMKKKLDQELKSRLAELNKCQKDLEFVKEKSKNWPDVWPDWDPNPPQEQPDEN